MVGFVYIVESPNDADLLLGRTEGRTLCEALQLSGTANKHNLAVSRGAFEYCLVTGLIQESSAAGVAPVLHLSCHGNKQGIELTDGTRYSWPELRTLLLQAMNSTALLIGLSSCEGASGAVMAMFEDTHQPFWALVGPTTTVAWSDAAVAFTTFYHLWFKQFTLGESVTRMNAAAGLEHAFVAYSGQHLRDAWNSRATLAQVQRDQN